MSFIKHNFAKKLIISFYHTKLITFLNTCEMSKTSYNLGQMKYVTIIKLSFMHKRIQC